MRSILILFTAAALTGSLCAGAEGTSASSQPAKWVSRDVNFTYQGFTTTYSCDGLRDAAVAILSTLGARKQDMDVRESPCAARGANELSFSPGIRGKISVLVPATADEIARNDPGIVPAHWKTVDLIRAQDHEDARRPGNCELLEQAKRYLLPLFTSRNLDYSSNCVPHEVLLGGTFKVDVLKADAAPSGR